MKIQSMKTSSLIEYGFNNRIHADSQVDKIATSIQEFGFNQPVVIDEDNIILVGHGRLAAAKKLGLEEVPVLRREGLSDAQKRAYRILDNKLQGDSEWHFDNLKVDLDILSQSGFSLTDYGMETLYSQVCDLVPEPQVSEEISLPDGDMPNIGQRSFNLSREQMEHLDEALDIAKGMGDFGETGNPNANGNALARVCEIFLTQNRG
jgi:ParB family chromosome partitioning protein